MAATSVVTTSPDHLPSPGITRNARKNLEVLPSSPVLHGKLQTFCGGQRGGPSLQQSLVASLTGIKSPCPSGMQRGGVCSYGRSGKKQVMEVGETDVQLSTNMVVVSKGDGL